MMNSTSLRLKQRRIKDKTGFMRKNIQLLISLMSMDTCIDIKWETC